MIGSLNKINATFLSQKKAGEGAQPKKWLPYASVGGVGAIGGYLIPAFKDVDVIDKKILVFDPSYNPVYKNGKIYVKPKRVLTQLLRKEQNYPLKVLNAIIGAVVGLGAAYLICGRKQTKQSKTNES